MRRPLSIGVALLAVAGAAWPAGASAQHGLALGFIDQEAFQTTDPSGPDARAVAIQQAKLARARIIRVAASWRDIAPDRPPSEADALNPGWAGYDWAETDAVVRDIANSGLTVFLSFTSAPAWAEGLGRPALGPSAPRGTWRPDPAKYALFARAMARRYSGSFPDPDRPGRVLPRVRYYQGWNEPNLTDFLTPQWERRRGRFVPSSPAHFRRLQNAFYDAVKSVLRDAYVVSAGTAPYGEQRPGERRMQPALFTRELLCVAGRARPRARRSCPGGPAKFDALAHHPYPIGPPRRHAINPDDVSIPDLPKLTRPLSVARRAGHVSPRRGTDLWVTEISWESKPPDPLGIPAHLHARYITGALETLWRQGVSVVVYWRLRDEAPDPSYGTTFQSGPFARGPTPAQDTAKPALRSFAFPFTAYRRSGAVELWGLAPGAGRVVIERRRGSRWSRVATVRARGDRLFRGRIRVREGAELRARQGAETSLGWPVF
jgi:hypothetical protein